MTPRSYFGKMNSILGSVVPFAMFANKREDFWNRLNIASKEIDVQVGIYNNQSHFSSTAEA